MKLEMVCVCDADGVREVEERRKRIFKRMQLDDKRSLTTAVILSLAFDFQAEAGLYADQWFGVAISTPLLNEALFIECDEPADGFAALWEKLAEEFPARVSVKPDQRPASVEIMERISTHLFGHYMEAEGAYQRHKEKHKDDKEHNIWSCTDCTVLLGLSVITHDALNRIWGTDALDEAMEKALGE